MWKETKKVQQERKEDIGVRGYKSLAPITRSNYGHTFLLDSTGLQSLLEHWIIASVVSFLMCLVLFNSSCSSLPLLLVLSIEARSVSFCSFFAPSLLTFTLFLQVLLLSRCSFCSQAAASCSEDEERISSPAAVDANDEDAVGKEEVDEEEEEEEEEEDEDEIADVAG